MFLRREKPKKKDELISQTVKELNKLKKEKLKEDSIEKLNEILRIFLHAKYGLKRSLTVEEILKEISITHSRKKEKMALVPFIVSIYKEEYKSEEKVSKKEFNKLLEEMKKTIKSFQK